MNATALVIRHAIFPLWTLKNRSARLKYLAQLERSQYWSRERLLEHQWSSFRRLVAHAFETCPFYRRSFERAGITPDDLRSPEDVAKVPMITKEDIQAHREEMVSSRYRREALIRDMTGGSTGSPMQFYYDADRRDSREAAAMRHDRWAGWDLGERRAILWGAPQDTRIDAGLKSRLRERLIERRLILDAASLDEEAMSRFARELLRYRPGTLLAYANTLGLFARYLRDQGIEAIRPRGIISSAEVLTPENRQLVEEVFSCRVFDRYGSREFGLIASECEAHCGMHVNAENLLVEAVVDGTPRVDEDGEIVVTDLRNYAMPMIRYRIRDVGRITGRVCECGRGLPLMELSGGRVTDFLTATDGRKVSGIVVATYVITNIPGIRQVQFVQDTPGAVTINLVRGGEWSAETQRELISRARRYLGEDMQFELSFRDRIPAEKSGKYRFCISTL